MTADHEQDANGDDAVARQLESYLATHAQRITPPLPDVDGVMHRVRGHRRRRGAGLAVVGCVALLAATTVVVRAHGTEYPVAVGAGGSLNGGGAPGSGAVSADTEGTSPTDSTPEAPPAPLQWQLVRPHAGLGFNQGTASAAGATYSISTAPGPTQDNSAHGTVYRTTDGVEWSRVAIPSDFAPTAIGGSSDQVYALGTVAAGGSLGISLLSGGPSGELGGPVTVPVDLHALSTDAGGPVRLLTGAVGAGHGHVTVELTLQSDLASVVHATNPQIDTSHGVVAKADGVDVLELPPAPSSDSTTSTSAPAGSVVVPRFQKTVAHHYTWDELHMSDTQRAYVDGRPLLYQSADGTNFSPVALPADALGRAYVVSTPDGYRLLSTSYASNATKVYASTDLSSWSARGTLPGVLEDAGVVDGHFLVATDAFPAGPVVHREAANGTWSALALDDVAGTTGSSSIQHGWLPAAIGPLGVAAVSWTTTGSTMTGTLIYSRDGVHPTVVPVPTTSDGVPTWMQTVQVTADAITVGLSLGRTTQPAGGPAMAAFVGVP